MILTGAGLRFGIDVVRVARAEQLLDRLGSSVGDRVATTEEAAWMGREPARLGAVLSIKEASIKAMGGRPESFAWQQICTSIGDLQVTLAVTDLVDRGGWPAPVAEVFRGFAAGAGLTQVTAVTCVVRGPSLARMHDRLVIPQNVCGAACFGLHDEHVMATACFWGDGGE